MPIGNIIYNFLESMLPELKGQCQEIFIFSFPQAPEYPVRAVRKFFGKFLEIFAAQGAPPVSLTSVANGKNLLLKKVVILFGNE